MKTLPGQELRPSDYSDMRSQLRAVFYEIIFRPVIELLKPHNKQVKMAARDLRNAKADPVVNALLSGQVQYEDSTFSGEFSATISRALRSYGAVWDKRAGTFAITPELLPPSITEAAAQYQDAAVRLHDALRSKLDEVERGLSSLVAAHEVDSTVTITKMEQGFNSDYAKAIGKDELSPQARVRLEEDYSNNMKLWVQKFSAEEIRDLRDVVSKNAEQGYRFDHLVKKIQNRYDVSQTKAEFLARQETSLLVSKHREQRFGDVGITEYIWDTAGDADVRPSHKKLNGRKFKFAEPPVVDEATGRRANPGEDFSCRCAARPVIPSEVLVDA